MAKKTLTDANKELDVRDGEIVGESPGPAVNEGVTEVVDAVITYELPGGIQLPAMPGEVAAHGTEAVREQFVRTTYVNFASTRSKSWGKLAIVIPGLQDSDIVLVPPEPLMPMKLDRLRFALIAARQFFGVMDEQGYLESANWDKPGSGMKEYIETIMVVLTPDGKSMPARMTFKTTKCGAAHKAIAALAISATPKWGTISEAHKASMAAPYPWMRFTATVTVGPPRVGRASGMTYRAADAAVSPTGPTEWVALAYTLQDKDQYAALKLIGESFQRRIDEIDEVVKATDEAAAARAAKGK